MPDLQLCLQFTIKFHVIGMKWSSSIYICRRKEPNYNNMALARIVSLVAVRVVKLRKRSCLGALRDLNKAYNLEFLYWSDVSGSRFEISLHNHQYEFNGEFHCWSNLVISSRRTRKKSVVCTYL